MLVSLFHLQHDHCLFYCLSFYLPNSFATPENVRTFVRIIATILLLCQVLFRYSTCNRSIGFTHVDANLKSRSMAMTGTIERRLNPIRSEASQFSSTTGLDRSGMSGIRRDTSKVVNCGYSNRNTCHSFTVTHSSAEDVTNQLT